MQANKKLATTYAAILGQMIRRLRESRGTDQSSLAHHLGVSIMTISRIENGDTILDVPQMEKMTQFFNVDPVLFFQESLDIKAKFEMQNYEVFQNKKEINQHPDMAIISVAAILGLVVGIKLLSKK